MAIFYGYEKFGYNELTDFESPGDGRGRHLTIIKGCKRIQFYSKPKFTKLIVWWKKT